MSKLNVLGYATLSDGMNRQVFGDCETSPVKPETIKSIKASMENFGVTFPIENPGGFFMDDFELPKLKGKNIKEHFENISKSLVSDQIKVMKDFAYSDLPKKPSTQYIVNTPGWTKYIPTKDGFDITHPEVIEEDIAVFDCETFVKGSDFSHPILASAVTDTAYYIWMHECYVDPSIEYYTTLVPVGDNKIFIAHNVAYDRARCAESYDITKKNYWFDTMSAHINVSGLASGQRWWYVQKTAKKSSFKADPIWADKGSLNGLVDCYNFHCQPMIPLEPEDKKIRDVFVVSETMGQICELRDELTQYALRDAEITQELYSIVILKYLQNNPSLTTLLGHFGISSAFLPVVDDWKEWFEGCEKIWNESIARQEEILGQMAQEVYDAWNQGEVDIESDPWLSQMDWECNFKLTKAGKPSSKWYGIPKWLRSVSEIQKTDEGNKLVIGGISTKNRLSHFLLRLKWDDKPMTYFSDRGWCFMNDDLGEYTRVPHPKGEGENVGGVLSKDYADDFETGMLSSDLPQAEELIKLAINVSYWTSVRSRVREQHVSKVNNPLGKEFNLIVPATVPHNTSTNRAGENLWLTVPDPKYDKIGSEIKTRVQAPDGWIFVESDFDAQEAVVASIFADSYHKVAGSTQFSHAILAGSKDNKTDMHSMTAKAIGISRAVAKGCNYGMLYGCGAKTLANTIRKGNKSISMKQAIEMGKKLIEIKKGRKAYRGMRELIGGSDSYAYNEMAKIACEKTPINPLSGTKMSTAFRPSSVGDDFWTMRNNWCIQSTGSAMLHAFMAAMEWLIKDHGLNAKFNMSVHDSILYMCPKEEAEKVAALFQVAHAWCWAWLRYNYGIYELPVANAWLSSIEIDHIFRKAANASTNTVSQQNKEHDGKSVTVKELIPVFKDL